MDWTLTDSKMFFLEGEREIEKCKSNRQLEEGTYWIRNGKMSWSSIWVF